MAQHVRDLAHVNHEGALRDAEGFSGDYASENSVCQANCCFSCRHKGPVKYSGVTGVIAASGWCTQDFKCFFQRPVTRRWSIISPNLGQEDY